MVVTPFDLRLLAKTRGDSLSSLEIWGCKLFSEDGLEDIARCCIDLTSLRFGYNDMEDYCAGGYRPNGKWVHELALCNSVMESLEFDYPFGWYDTEDVTLLAKKCSNSLVSLNISPQRLRHFRQVFKHAKKLEHFGYGVGEEDHDYSGLRFPPNIRGLGVEDLTEASFPFLLPYLNQLRELELKCVDIESNGQCYFFKRCPNLEVLNTWDICEDKGLKVIGQFCKKLRKLTHHGWVTRKGLIYLAQGCPNLDSLEVYSKDISNKTFECVGTRLENLRDFRIHVSENGGNTDFPLDNGVRAMLIGCKKLERLDISLFPGALTDIGLGYVGAYGHNLRHVSLCNTGESDVGLVELLKGCPKLRKLKLNGCPFKEQAIASFVFSINQSLRYVWLDYGSPDVSVLTRPMVSAQVNSVSEASVLQEEANILFYAKEATPSFADQLKIAEETRQRGDTVGEKKKLTYADTIGERGGKSGEKKKLKFADMERMKERERRWRWGWTSASFSKPTEEKNSAIPVKRVHVPPPQRHKFTPSEKQKCTPFPHWPNPTPFSHTPKQFKQPPPPSKLKSERTHFTTPSSSSTNEYHSHEEDVDFGAIFKKGAEDIGKLIDALDQKPKNQGTSDSSNADAR